MEVSWGSKVSKNEPEPAATSSAVALRGKVEVDFGPGHWDEEELLLGAAKTQVIDKSVIK